MITSQQAHQLYRYMRTARELDERERVLVARNQAHFHVSGAGHEASACLARHLTGSDWLHLHYRDKALLLTRGLSVQEFFRSLLGRGTAHSAGRQMSAHFSAPDLNVLSLVGPVGNNALQAVGHRRSFACKCGLARSFADRRSAKSRGMRTLVRRQSIAQLTAQSEPSQKRLCSDISRSTRRPQQATQQFDNATFESSLFPRNQTNHMPNNCMVLLSRPACVVGGRVVSTELLASNIPGWTAKEAIKRTGVVSRNWIDAHENVVSLAVRAALKLIDGLGSNLPPISTIVCSTTSPHEATPSIACQVATSLMSSGCLSQQYAAFDINAACSGFLYAVRLAADHLACSDAEAVLVLTSEVISPNVDVNDPVTAFLFGDAATATLVTRSSSGDDGLVIRRPRIFSTPDPDRAISSPCIGAAGFVRMHGIAVARTAYKAMGDAVGIVSAEAGIDVKKLGALVPHPGSMRVLQNVAEMLQVDESSVFHTLSDTGNTSSSSIPLALDHYWDQLPRERQIAFVAFGAGFTSAATIGEFKDHD